MATTLPRGSAPHTMVVTRIGALWSSAVALLPVLGWLLGDGLFHWLTPVVALVVLPILDTLVGPDDANIGPDRE